MMYLLFWHIYPQIKKALFGVLTEARLSVSHLLRAFDFRHKKIALPLTTFIIVFFLLLSSPFMAYTQSGSTSRPIDKAKWIKTNTTSFDGALSGTDTRVQTALDTLDDITTSLDPRYVNLDSEATDITNGTFNLTTTGTAFRTYRPGNKHY